jgi:hypothetical protein
MYKFVLAAAAIGFSATGAAAPLAHTLPGAAQAVSQAPVRIVSVSGGQRMSTYDASTSPGGLLIADASNVWYSRNTEVWVVSNDPSGFPVIKNNASGLCLQPTDPGAPAIGMSIVQQPCNNSMGQEWNLAAYSAPTRHEYIITPRRNPNAAITVTNWGNIDWSNIPLDHPYAASNRLWMLYPE